MEPNANTPSSNNSSPIPPVSPVLQSANPVTSPEMPPAPSSEALPGPSAPAPTVITPSGQPPAAPVPAVQSVVTVGGGFEPETAAPIAVADPPKPVVGGPSRWKSKKLWLVVLAPLLLIGAAAGFYFGYYMNPTHIYSQSLSNTGKGYDKLIDYIDAQAKAGKHSYMGDGSYSYKSSGFSSDGKMSLKSDGDNVAAAFDIGAVGSRVNIEVRTFKSSGNTPDLYIKASGIKGLGGFTGSPEIDAAVNKLDGTWTFVDHTLLDSLIGQGEGGEVKGPTREEVMDAARAFGRVNQDYVFTANKGKSVLVIVKRHGFETAEGHKTYRYTLGLDKANVKNYIDAQKAALKSSKLGAWLKKNKYDSDVYKSFDDAKKSADSIKSSDTFDVYMDVNKRMVYKVRLLYDKDPANNFTDIGLDYKGGSSYPFFVSGKEKSDGSTNGGEFRIILDADTNAIQFKANLNMGKEGNFTANFTYKPTVTKPKIEKPVGARTLSEVLNELGLGGLLTQYENQTQLPQTGSDQPAFSL